MACNVSEGINRPCTDAHGGVFHFYITDRPISGMTIAEEGTDSAITSISGESSALTFYPYWPNKNSSEWIETQSIAIENGTINYEQKATMQFSKLEAGKANKIKILAQGDLLIVVKDKNDNYILMGAKEGAYLSTGTSGTGKAGTDLSGYMIELIANESEKANHIESTSLNFAGGTGNLTVTV